MKTLWSLQDAKNRFSEVVEKTLAEGPQTVTRRGTPVVVILPVEDYVRHKTGGESLAGFFRRSPLRGIDLDLSRAADTGRKVKL